MRQSAGRLAVRLRALYYYDELNTCSAVYEAAISGDVT